MLLPLSDRSQRGKTPAFKEGDMERKTMLYAVRVGMVTGIFAAGFLCGSMTEQSANAEMKEVGQEIMKRAAGSGGIVGSVAQLGTTIGDMEKQIDGLQKNLGVLKKVKTSLSGVKIP
jgi:hypothetical protein